MVTYPIPLPDHTPATAVAATIESVLVAAGLNITMNQTLKQYPGCIHWHVTCGRETGTLEVTLWPHAGRAWFSVHDRRSAGWIDTLLPGLQQTIQEQLAQVAPRDGH